MRRLSALVALALALVAVAPGPPAHAADIGPYRGLGSWVDAYDYSPAFQTRGDPPPITPATVADMATLGVRTLYLQAAKDDDRSPGNLVDRKLVGEFLKRAHAAGVAVVAWYLPTLSDLDTDMRHLQALHAFRASGARFDAIALDIEWTQGVPDTTQRNNRVVELSQRLRKLVGKTYPLGAIVLPAVQTEVVNPALWPDFPYQRLKSLYDVWLPMAYFTFRSSESGYRDAFRYTEESVTRLRVDLDEKDAPVHVIGGIADVATPSDYEALLRAAESTKAVGYSVYDFNTTTSGAWAYLRGRATSTPG